jgi:hypothetical protein
MRSLAIGDKYGDLQSALAAPCARALAAALRRMPARRALEPWRVALPDASAAELFSAEGAAPGMHKPGLFMAYLTPEAALALAASGWRLEELRLYGNRGLGAAGLAEAS